MASLSTLMLLNTGLLGSFVSYQENIELWIRAQGLYSQHFIFFATYKLAE